LFRHYFIHGNEHFLHWQLGSINGGKVQDRYFRPDREEGPFATVKSFNDFVFAVATRQTAGPDGYGGIEGLNHPDMLRNMLPDTESVLFCHGDLTPSNIIIVGPPGSYSVAAIIDWEQAGWYPEYWEFCKMLSGVDDDHDWHTEAWAEKLTSKSFEDASVALSEYSMWRGGA
jgi:hypothetical protein